MRTKNNLYFRVFGSTGGTSIRATNDRVRFCHLAYNKPSTAVSAVFPGPETPCMFLHETDSSWEF